MTVTHPEIERFFMTIPEACQLIMQAAVIGQGGETFVLDMGEPVKIRYLAEQMIRLAGREPGREIPIVYTGLCPGEKLYEELFYDAEAYAPTPHAKIRVARAGVTEGPGAGAGDAARGDADPTAALTARRGRATPLKRKDFAENVTLSADPGAGRDPEAVTLGGLASSPHSLQTALAALPAALERGDEAELTALLAAVVTDWRPPSTALGLTPAAARGT